MTTLVTALSEAVSTHPEGVALVYGDQQLNFTELDEISDGLARALVTQGIEPGDRIAVLDRNSLWFFVILFAVMKRALCWSPSIFGWRRLRWTLSFGIREQAAVCRRALRSFAYRRDPRIL